MLKHILFSVFVWFSMLLTANLGKWFPSVACAFRCNSEELLGKTLAPTCEPKAALAVAGINRCTWAVAVVVNPPLEDETQRKVGITRYNSIQFANHQSQI